MNGDRADQQRRGGAKEEERVRRASSEGGGEQEQGGRARDGIAASRVQATGGRPQGGFGPIAVLRRRDPALLEPLVHAGDTGPR